MTEQQRKQEQEDKRRRAVAAEVAADFAARRELRRSLEQGWELNMKFLSGDQFCELAPGGEIEEEERDFLWRSRQCFNHIAPTIDARLARLAKVRPSLEVRAFSDSEADMQVARLSSDILRSVKGRLDLDKIVAEATLWSEVCGTAFYKVVWNYDDGKVIGSDTAGHPIREGDVNVVALSPFEIYPDTLNAGSMSEVKSIIHAKAVSVEDIFERFGVEIPGRTVSEFSLAPYSSPCNRRHVSGGEQRPAVERGEILIERYTRPCGKYPEGRLEIVAGDKLLFEGPLPYQNGDRGERTLPFIRQTCIALAGAFFGTSVIDRMIPLQRAYNAVRNRKHEFLNRLTSGVIAVEDGSVDAEALADEGLGPGKILVYRQGSAAPAFLDCGKLPAEFAQEEERIAGEFVLVSGVSEISRNSATPANVTSAVGLQLLLDQDTNRMHMTAESVERAVKEVGKQILHLYKQFAHTKRLLRMTGTGGETGVVYFDASDISADDVEFASGYDRTPEEIKEDILKLLDLGLLKDDDGNIAGEVRTRVLDALGYGSLENARDISYLHIRKAERENVRLAQEDVEADSYDDHAVHRAEHLRALLSGRENDAAAKARIMRHLESHRRLGG